MLGVVFHPPSLVSLMVDREKFTTVVVPSEFEDSTKEVLEDLFSKRAPKGTRKLLLVEGVDTLSKVASLFPEQKVRVVIFDVAEKLSMFTNVLIDYNEVNGIKKLVSLKPSALNQGLTKLKPSYLEEFRVDFRDSEKPVSIAIRDGVFSKALKNSSKPLQRVSCQYLLGLTSFAALKRAARKDKSKVNIVTDYTDSDRGVALVHAFMDMSVYGTDSKEAALFSDADLEDLRFISSIITPEADLKFSYKIPDKLKLARD